MKKIYLDGSIVSKKEEIHLQIKERMGFPEYYGKNLDALYDMLSTWSEPVEVCILNPSSLFLSLGKYGHDFIKTIEEAHDANWRIKVSLEEELHETR
jgi:ribonuclease inhibitor